MMNEELTYDAFPLRNFTVSGESANGIRFGEKLTSMSRQLWIGAGLLFVSAFTLKQYMWYRISNQVLSAWTS